VLLHPRIWTDAYGLAVENVTACRGWAPRLVVEAGSKNKLDSSTRCGIFYA
jgi:hypothetical protein